MTLLCTRFYFQHHTGRVSVTFEGDAVSVLLPNKAVHTIQNRPRKWGGRPYKPCLTHATELASQYLAKPKQNNFAKQRREKQSPSLRIHQEVSNG